jgi:3-oxoacyl-[acyl-carrier-protein] synthase II
MCGQGLSSEEAWKAICGGTGATKPFRLFDASGLPTNFGVELPAGADELFEQCIKPRSRKQMTRGTMIACTTAHMAIADANLNSYEGDRTRLGAVIGSTGTGYAPLTPDIDEHRILRNMASAPASWISMREKLFGPSYTVSTACSSGTYALHAACMLIASGQCDIVLAGSAESTINRLDVQGFSSLMALSEQNSDYSSASRPFDANRTGFVMGEGGGMLIVESLESARNRNARIYAEVFMPGILSEAYNILSPTEGGTGMATCMKKALENAGIPPEAIDYINAHGTSTILNDKYEVQAIKTIFGSHAQKMAVSSTKSMTGHCLSGAAGVESVICCLALRDGIIPPTINYSTPDPDCAIDVVPTQSRKKDLTYVMSNSFAFGGHNGVAIFKKL